MKLLKFYIIFELLISFPLQLQKSFIDFNSCKIITVKENYSVGFWKRYKYRLKEAALNANRKEWKRNVGD